jgi:hypothetical protein
LRKQQRDKPLPESIKTLGDLIQVRRIEKTSHPDTWRQKWALHPSQSDADSQYDGQIEGTNSIGRIKCHGLRSSGDWPDSGRSTGGSAMSD